MGDEADDPIDIAIDDFDRCHGTPAAEHFDLKYPPKSANPFAREKTNPMPAKLKPLFRNARVVGSQFRDEAAKAAYASLAKGEVLTLELEPTNEHDEFAVKVLVEGLHIGYIPREMSAVLHATGVGADVVAVVSEVGTKGGVMCAVGILAE